MIVAPADLFGPWTYLLLTVGWALPVVVVQWAFAYRALARQWRLLVAGIGIPTLYLCAADALAIRVGIWSLSPELTLDIWLGGLPLEEAVFFLLTNVMVVQGILGFEARGLFRRRTDGTAAPAAGAGGGVPMPPRAG